MLKVDIRSLRQGRPGFGTVVPAAVKPGGRHGPLGAARCRHHSNDSTMRYLLIAAFCLVCSASFAQEARDVQAIHNICGCFEVDFRYAETFSPDTGYRFHPRYHTYALELAYPEETTGRRVVIQHLLLVDDSTVIKHWREDWAYEQRDRWVFRHDAAWSRVTTPVDSVRGAWTQTVWEVDDAPRYQGVSRWVAVNGKYVWENTTDAPLPRREYTKRNDYNVMERTNRIYPTDTGWIHEQDNRKLVRVDGVPDREVAEEKGYNVYRRVDDGRCAAAAAWWRAHRAFWNTVRAAWAETLKDRQTAHLLPSVDGRPLFEALDALEARGGVVTRAEIAKVLNNYIE